jgi:hypothetical protein
MKHCAGALVISLGLCVPTLHAGAQGHKEHHGPMGEHRSVEDSFAVDRAVAPRLRIDLAMLDDGQHELRLAVENFGFVPEHGALPRVVGEGHAHLYIDRVKVGRLFETAHRLPAFTPGVHEIAVDLVTTDHAVYSVDGHPVAARIVLRSGRAAAARPARRLVKDLTVTMVGGEVVQEQRRPRTLQVSQGDVVRILWQSDAAVQLHLHGYDIQAEVAPGVPTTMQFDADIAGRFSIASHGGGRRGGHAHRGLLYLEVHPK